MSEVIPAVSAIDRMADPGAFIIAMEEHAKACLLEALNSGLIEQLVEMKAQGDALRAYGTQKKLGKEAVLAATEIVRRAERCIGLAIRKGQKEGKIRRRGQGRGHTHELPSPVEYASHDELLANGAGIYHMTDDVTDEQFEAGLANGKAEGNLSRANVVRKVKGNGKDGGLATLREMAAAGHTSDQIAKKLGIHRETVRRRAARAGVVIHANRVVGATRRLNHNRVLREFANSLGSLLPSCEMIDVAKVDRAVLSESLSIVDEAVKALTQLRRRLKRGRENDR